MTHYVTVGLSAGVARLTLNDEPTRNSLSTGMMTELREKLADCDKNTEIGAIIIAAKGKVFSSGHNLKELTAHRSDSDKGLSFYEQTFGLCAKLMQDISHHRCAIIAEVDGLASAAGCQLVATCDLAYASSRAGFCTPGVNIGLFCSTPMVAVSRAMPSKLAMEMLLVGGVHDAAFALRASLVNAVLPAEELTPHVQAIATTIATKSTAAIRYGKRSFHDQRFLSLEDAYSLTAGVMARNMMDGAACEGLDAFINKRHPHWPMLT